MSIPSVFSFENAQVRALGTPDLPLFVAVDAAGALGYKDKTNAIKQHVDPEDIIKSEIETNGGRQTVNCVNESGLYALIFGSKLESAKRFKRWVTSEVLPAIRKTGRYEAQETITPAAPVRDDGEMQAAVARVSQLAEKDLHEKETMAAVIDMIDREEFDRAERALTAYKAQIMSKAELIAEAIAQVRMAKEREVFQWTGG